MNQTSHPPLLGPKSRQQQQPEVALEARHCAARIGLPTRHTTILILVAGCASAWLSSTSKPEERWFHSAGAAAAAGRPDPRRRLCYTFCTLSLSLPLGCVSGCDLQFYFITVWYVFRRRCDNLSQVDFVTKCVGNVALYHCPCIGLVNFYKCCKLDPVKKYSL